MRRTRIVSWVQCTAVKNRLMNAGRDSMEDEWLHRLIAEYEAWRWEDGLPLPPRDRLVSAEELPPMEKLESSGERFLILDPGLLGRWRWSVGYAKTRIVSGFCDLSWVDRVENYLHVTAEARFLSVRHDSKDWLAAEIAARGWSITHIAPTSASS